MTNNKIYDITPLLGKIHNCDCLDFMRQLPDKCIDLVLTDPPYGDGIGYGRYGKEIANNDTPEINNDFLKMAYPILKDNKCCYVFTNWKYYPIVLEYGLSVGFAVENLICIVKNNIGMGGGLRNQHEFCIVFKKGDGCFLGKDFSNVQKMNHINHDINSHPHEKCMHLIKRIIEHSSVQGDVVLDCFMGSGTTAVACERLGRKWFGCELEPKYCEIANKRIEAERNQLKLF